MTRDELDEIIKTAKAVAYLDAWLDERHWEEEKKKDLKELENELAVLVEKTFTPGD